MESEPKAGTTFHFTINSDEQAENENLDQNANDQIPVFHIRNKTILIVEDDPCNSALFDEILMNSETTLLHAETGQEAINIALQFKPDIILMDIGLPDMSGYDVITKILSQKPESLIIAQTAYASDEDRAKALGLGCAGYISKPIKVNQFLSIIENYLAQPKLS